MSHAKPRILLVEDDKGLGAAYQVRLEAEGFDTHWCLNGEAALAAAQKYRPDLILLDLIMPKMSGFEVLDILRRTPETAKIKIIILTALSKPSDIERAKQLGANDYLVKSQAVISDVIARIRYHLGLVAT
jgi:DNA-binding response OmpR family regulator